jgi:hypothetical protein
LLLELPVQDEDSVVNIVEHVLTEESAIALRADHSIPERCESIAQPAFDTTVVLPGDEKVLRRLSASRGKGWIHQGKCMIVVCDTDVDVAATVRCVLRFPWLICDINLTSTRIGLVDLQCTATARELLAKDVSVFTASRSSSGDAAELLKVATVPLADVDDCVCDVLVISRSELMSHSGFLRLRIQLERNKRWRLQQLSNGEMRLFPQVVQPFGGLVVFCVGKLVANVLEPEEELIAKTFIADEYLSDEALINSLISFAKVERPLLPTESSVSLFTEGCLHYIDEVMGLMRLLVHNRAKIDGELVVELL